MNHLELDIAVHTLKGTKNDYVKSVVIADNKVWALGHIGLYKFDGTSFNLYYKLKEEDIGFLPDSFLPDRSGGLWFQDLKGNMSTKKASYFNIKTKTIENGNKETLIKLFTNASKAYSDDNNNIWFKHGASIFLKYHNATIDTFDLPKSLTNTHISEIEEEHFVVSRNGFYKYEDPQNQNIANIKSEVYMVEKGKDYDYHVYCKSYSPKSLKLYLIKDNIVQDSFTLLSKNNHLRHKKIMYHESTAQVIFNEDSKLLTVDNDNNYESKLNSNLFEARTSVKDKYGNLYLPSQDAVVSISHKKYGFQLINRSRPSSIRHITIKNDSIIQFASYNGHYEYNLNTHKEEQINKDIISYDKAKLNDSLHIITYATPKPILRLDTPNGSTFKALNIIGPSNPSDYLHLLAYDSKSDRIWMANKQSKIYHAKLNRDSLTVIEFPIEDKEGIHDLSVSDGKLFIAHEQGISIIDSQLNLTNLNLDILNNEACQTVTATNDEIIIGASHSIYILNKNLNLKESYGANIDLNSHIFYTIEKDINNNLWSGTNKGLVFIDRQKNNYIAFDNPDHVGQLDFNYSSSTQASDGTLYFGGINRLIQFHPDSIINEVCRNSKALRVYDALTRDRNSELYYHVEDPTELILDDHHPEIKIIFNADNPFAFSHEFLEVQIGEDAAWEEILDGTLTLKELDYGKNIISVRNKLSPEFSISVPIHSKSPFYFKTQFWILGTLGIFLIANFLNVIKNKRLEKSNKILEEQVTLRTKEIIDQNAALNLSNQSKDKIFSVLAHDLRSPLSNLRDITETVAFLINNKKTSELSLASDQLQDRTNELTYLIDNLLHWSLQQQGKTYFIENTFRILGPVKETAEQFKSQIKIKNLKFKIDIPLQHSITTDHGAFQAVVRNLIHNAIKYSENLGAVEIKSTVDKETIQLSIKDYGVGITQDQIANLQKGTYISTRGVHNEKGIGIGFYLCKYFAEKMSGRIHIKSALHVGTTMTLILPIQPPNPLS